MRLRDRLFSFFRQNSVPDSAAAQTLFHENEIRANRLIERFLFACAALLSVCWLLNTVGVFAVEVYVFWIFPVGIAAYALPAVICRVFREDRKWIKYMMIVSVTLTSAYLDGLLTYNVSLLILLPVIFSCRYYSCSFTVKTVILSMVLFTVSAYCGALLYYDDPDLNFAAPVLQDYIRNVMLQSFLPRWIAFIVFSALCYEIARRGRNMILEQDTISRRNARVDTELEMAYRIQTQALPDAEKLPENRYRRLDLAAEMLPAKEVGGDFYDFFYPDPGHLALIAADVADKGIAASLYMMMSKSFLDSRITGTLSPGRVLEEVNRLLFPRSVRGMFVTVWLGILDLKTGELVTANAGHEYPAIRRKNGGFELLKDRHGFVLGGRKNAVFPEERILLEEGDSLFVYTDGVPEANDAAGNMYGTDRMLVSLDRRGSGDMKALIGGVRADLERFSAGTTQFDDITMLALRLGAPLKDTGICVEPVLDRLEEVQEYIRGFAGGSVSSLREKQIAVAADEIFSNIVKFSGATRVTVLCERDDEKLRITFGDNGAPFDPLSRQLREPPAGPGKRKPGGLGILIVSRTMDGMEYRYENGMNMLTILALIKEE